MAERRHLRSCFSIALCVIGMFAASLPLLASPQVSSTIVISQVYGGGGNSGAPYQNDFIELFNRGTTAASLAGWSVQYAASTSGTWHKTDLAGVSLAPGQYYLIQQGSGGTNGIPLPTADVTGTTNLSATAGKVALVNHTTTLSGTCPSGVNIVDFVGYGSSANCFETAHAPAPSNTNALLRKTNGCTETDDNSADFATGAPNPRNTSSPAISCSTTAEKLLITEVLYDGTQTDEGDEFIEITNPLTYTVNLTGYKIGDEETSGGGEGMYEFPAGTTLVPNAILIVARNAAQFRARFGFDPHFELVTTGALTDTLTVPNLSKYSAWANGSPALSNSGDEVLLLGPVDQRVDAVAWESGNFAIVGLTGDANASEPKSLQRYGTSDTNNMTFDFLRGTPTPGVRVEPPAPPAPVPGRAMPNGMFAFWGDLHAHTTASDGSGPPRMAFATARAAGLHFFSVTDHDHYLTTEEWNEIGSAANDATVDNAFIALRGFEYTHASKGHLNVFNTATWINHTDAAYDTLAEFYAWLGTQPSALAQFNHPDPRYGGDFDHFAYNAAASNNLALVEVGNNANTYLRFEAQLPAALNQRWRVAPSNNSDHHGTSWGSDSSHRTGVLAPTLTRDHLLDALRARRVFATEDANLALALQSNATWMGGTLPAQSNLDFTVTASDPDPEPLQLFLYDNGNLVRSQAFANSNVTWNVSVPGGTSHYYFARAQQADGDLAFTAPIWTDATPLPTPIPPTEPPREKKNDLGPVSAETARTTALERYVNLEACVTVPPGVMSDRFIFIQDTTGGIKVYLPTKVGNFPAMKLHDRVAVRGQTTTMSGERVVEVEDVGTIIVRGSCGIVSPRRYTTGAINPSREGWLVEVIGSITSITLPYEFQVDDGSGAVTIVIDPTTHIRISSLVRGRGIRVIGIVSRSRRRTVIYPRYNSDLEARAAPTATRANPTATRTRTVTPTPSLARIITPIATLTRVLPTPTRTLAAPSVTPAARLPAQDAHAFVLIGTTTSIAASSALLALALMILARWR